MIQARKMFAVGTNDEQLVSASLEGSRDAFGQIVARYQSLICSMAYSATGSLGQSEDLAQETFITAWKHLRLLREPAKLRAWLCGIARNRINYTLRREGHRPLTHADPLENAEEAPAPEPLPSDHAITREEEAILWRALEAIPDSYREPLVLFYRENKSIERVAQDLELSEDTVKQRLSRGRKLLQDQVLAFVEGALERTNPGQAFTLGVLTALPILAASSTSAATLGATAAKGGAVAKAAASMGLAGAILGPFVGMLSGVLGTRISIANTESPRERKFMVRVAWLTWSLVTLFCVLLCGLIFLALHPKPARPLLHTTLFVGLGLGYFLALLFLIVWSKRTQLRIRHEEATHRSAGTLSNAKPYYTQPFEYRSRWTFLGLPLIHIRMECVQNGKALPAKGWIAIGNIAYGALFACAGLAVAPISLGGLAIGLITIGGGGLGLLSFAGLAFGYWAVGGLAVGYQASGGAVIGWLAAEGGCAIARHFAAGGAAFAHHANDEAARLFFRDAVFLRFARLLTNRASFLVWLPICLLLWQATRVRSRRS